MMPQTIATRHAKATSPPKMDPAQHGPPSVINAGLMRTGTLSMARAYAILGLRAHHGCDMPHFPDRGSAQWARLERAAEGCWPQGPGARPSSRFAREDWDEIFGTFDAVTDVGAFFAEQLIAAYPEARVVVVQRDYDDWWSSFQSEVVDGLFSPAAALLLPVIGAITGLRIAIAMRKTLLGTFQARSLREIKANARATYFGYYERIRELVPPERRLEYKLGDGWEPLCEFLGKEVPSVPFPRLNDRAAHQAWAAEEFKEILEVIWFMMRPWIFGGLFAMVLSICLARYLS